MLAVVLALACTGEPVAEPAPERVAPNETGPYVAGVRTLVLDDPRGGTVQVEVWYPAIDPGTEPQEYPEFAISRDAHRDAAIDRRGSPYPLVAFSHGHIAIRYQNAYMVEHLATHGFVVVAPDHRDNTLLDIDSTRNGIVLVERPGEIIRAVDGLLADERLGPHVDGSQYVMSGHSFGGITTLSVAGGVLDIDAGLEHCAQAEDPPRGCDFFDPDALGDPALATPDPRVVAAVDISPGGGYGFGDDGLAGLAPMLAIAGNQDDTLPYGTEALPTVERMPGPTTLVTLDKAGHWGVSDICLIVPYLRDCAGEPEWIDPERAQYVVKTMVTAWATRWLTDDAVDEAWLTDAGWPEDDVTVEVRE